MEAESSRNPCPATDFNALPENCIANMLSLASAPETCRLSLLASTFRSAGESDTVWERFLPSDYQDIIARASDSSPPVFTSKKELYLSLSDHPLIVDGGTKFGRDFSKMSAQDREIYSGKSSRLGTTAFTCKIKGCHLEWHRWGAGQGPSDDQSFSLDKWSGKKCFMLAARSLTIVYADTPMYWRWISLPESSIRFAEVAELVDVCWLEIRGRISTRMISPDTNYAAYLVFKWTKRVYGFESQPVEGWVGLRGSEEELRSFYLDPNGGQGRQTDHIVPRRRGRMGIFNRTLTKMHRPQVTVPRESSDQCPKERGDGWLEMELGDYLYKSGEDGELEICLQEVKGGNWKSGLILQGIEIRPKNSK